MTQSYDFSFSFVKGIQALRALDKMEKSNEMCNAISQKLLKLLKMKKLNEKWVLMGKDGIIDLPLRCIDFRGDGHTLVKYVPPHKPSSTGYVIDSEGFNYYPSVFGMEIKLITESAETEPEKHPYDFRVHIPAEIQREIVNEHNKYNGWTNYETWRIALEYFDGFDNTYNYHTDSVYELAKFLEEIVKDHLDSLCENNVVLSYANAFIDRVNWREIAIHIIDERKN
jgi:hypothetical protein